MLEPNDYEYDDYSGWEYLFEDATWDEDEYRDREEEAHNEYLMHGGDQ